MSLAEPANMPVSDFMPVVENVTGPVVENVTVGGIFFTAPLGWSIMPEQTSSWCPRC